jgi:hypothetical protein
MPVSEDSSVMMVRGNFDSLLLVKNMFLTIFLSLFLSASFAYVSVQMTGKLFSQAPSFVTLVQHIYDDVVFSIMLF